MGVGGQRHAREKDPIPIVQEAGWAPGLFWTVVEYSSPPRFESDRPARTGSLFRLCFPGPPSRYITGVLGYVELSVPSSMLVRATSRPSPLCVHSWQSSLLVEVVCC